VDRFFSAAGILLLEGYGLTETAPVLGVRAQAHPVPGTVGPVFPGTEIKIVDEQGSALPPGTQGRVLARGPQVMKGYYKRQDLTDGMIGPEGWLDTGDLGMLTWDNELKITGRAKDTIVLLGGENVEPAPIEEKLRESEFIAQAMVVGQDQKFLAALIVPDFEALEPWAQSESILTSDREGLVQESSVRQLINQEIARLVNAQSGFRSFEQVNRFALLTKDFAVGEELSAKQEIKRHVIAERYHKEIETLFG
jgi:long-chain acyl-CoA synthetase